MSELRSRADRVVSELRLLDEGCTRHGLSGGTVTQVWLQLGSMETYLEMCTASGMDLDERFIANAEIDLVIVRKDLLAGVDKLIAEGH